jgi:sugar/nucleoside kinase (ribokinase family)
VKRGWLLTLFYCTSTSFTSVLGRIFLRGIDAIDYTKARNVSLTFTYEFYLSISSHLLSYFAAMRLLGFGAPLLDLTVPAVGRLALEKVGLRSGGHSVNLLSDQAKAEVVAAAMQHPNRVETVGGSVLNTLRVASYYARTRGGGADLTCAFLGSVGDDAEGETIALRLQRAGIKTTALQVIPNVRTGVCACLVDDQRERTLVTVRGAAGLLEPSFVTETRVGAFDAVYFGAFILSTANRREVAATLAQLAQARGVPFCLNLSAADVVKVGAPVRQFVLDLLPKCNIVFGNADEVKALLDETSEGTTTDLAMGLASMLESDGVAVVTDGSRPAAFALRLPSTASLRTTTATTSSVRAFTCPAPPMVPHAEIVDSNGCGDSFVGGYVGCGGLCVTMIIVATVVTSDGGSGERCVWLPLHIASRDSACSEQIASHQSACD